MDCHYVSRSISSRNLAFMLENWYNSKRDDANALKEKSMRLKQNVDLAVTVDIKEQQLLRALDRIKPLTGSSFDPDPKNCCMPDTRADLIETLVAFAVSEDTSRRLFLLSGIAGSGKSSVATSVAYSLYQRDCLTGSFFFKRDNDKLRIPANLLHTVAHSIARRHEPYMKALMAVLKASTTIEGEALSVQFDALLRKPLKMISSNPPPNQAIVAIVIDALDECDDPKSISSYLTEIVGLAPWLRVIVTSRPLDDIMRGLEYMTRIDLFSVDASGDILKFTQSRFAPDGPLHRLRSRVTEEDIEALARKAHGLFIWIKTVLSYIANLPYDWTKHKEMKSILSSSGAASPEKGVDELYLRVLHTAGNSRDAVKDFVGFIYITSRNRALPCKGLHAFITTSDPDTLVAPEDLDDLRSKLAAVIYLDSETKALRVCHPSFLDFIGSQARSQEFWSNPEVLDTMMAQRCFAIMKSGLKFNICELESSRQCNDEISDLKQRIPEELQYSAVYWLDHLTRSAIKEKLKDAHDFLYHARLFYWLEVLSAVSEINAAVQTLRDLVLTSKVCEHLKKEVAIANCRHRMTLNFTRYFWIFSALFYCFVSQCRSVYHTSTYHQ